MIKKSLLPVVLTWILVLTAVGLVKFDTTLFAIIFFIDVWFFSQPHVVSTFFKQTTYERFTKKSLFFWFVFLILALYIIYQFQGIVVIFSIYFFWQWFHYFRQNYGIALAQKSHHRKLETFFLHLMPIVALLALASKGPLGFLNYYISFPVMPFSFDFIRTVYFIIFFFWLILQLYSYKKNVFNFHNCINSLSAYVLYYWVYIYNDQFILGWLGMTFYHNTQYLLFNWSKKDFINNFFDKKGLIFFYMAMILVSIVVYGSIRSIGATLNSPFMPLVLILVLSLNMLHYVCDAIIWKNPIDVNRHK